MREKRIIGSLVSIMTGLMLVLTACGSDDITQKKAKAEKVETADSDKSANLSETDKEQKETVENTDTEDKTPNGDKKDDLKSEDKKSKENKADDSKPEDTDHSVSQSKSKTPTATVKVEKSSGSRSTSHTSGSHTSTSSNSSGVSHTSSSSSTSTSASSSSGSSSLSQTSTPAHKDTVTTKTKTVTQSISYKTVTQYDSTLAKGKTVVARKGQNGVKEITYKYTYVNSNYSSKKIVSSKVTKQPVNKIVKVGTKVQSSYASASTARAILGSSGMSRSGSTYSLTLGQGTDVMVKVGASHVSSVYFNADNYIPWKRVSLSESIDLWGSKEEGTKQYNWDKAQVAKIERAVRAAANAVYGSGTSKANALYSQIINSRSAFSKSF